MLNIVFWYSSPIFLCLIIGYAASHSYQESDVLGIFENTLDVGDVKHEGRVSYNSSTGEYTLAGSGENMWSDNNQFRYLWAPVQGDFILRAELEFIGEGADPHRKIGWTVRNTLSPGSVMVNAAIHGDGLTSLQYRKSKDAENLENVSPDSLPAVDGSDNPKQVTTSGVGASYLHGISPDNQIVIFTGNRNGKYDIFAADVNTMEETQLTDTPDLDDGSEYSPDGKYIYFNSNRTGTMQIWRMNADGSNQTQLTFDENFNEWFPHISPDGKKMGYMSYGTDVESADHPFYKNVTLRMMPLEDGEPEVIVYLYGGQGTINVPSWSPDSKKWHLLAIREGTISVLSMIKWRCLQIRDFTV